MRLLTSERRLVETIHKELRRKLKDKSGIDDVEEMLHE